MDERENIQDILIDTIFQRHHPGTFIAITISWCIKTRIDRARGRLKTYYFHLSG